MSSLTVENMSFASSGRLLLENVDVRFDVGELTAIVGPNGAGKSTLTRVLSGEIRPTRGRILVHGEDIGAIPPWRLAAKRIVMPQACELAFPFTAFEIATLGATGIGRNLNRAAQRDIARRALHQADVQHLSARSYQTLSGGEKQRVQFARALAQLEAGRTLEERQIVMLDEPIASLDLKHQLQVLHKVREFANRGLTVLAVLHDLQLAADIADKILVLSGGRVASYGRPKEILTPGLLKSVFEVGLTSATLPQSPWLPLAAS